MQTLQYLVFTPIFTPTGYYDKEVEDKEGRKSIKRVTTHGYYLRVKDPLQVLQQSAAVHAKEGRLAWPSCVPHDV